ncbi:nucleic acid-binding protein [Rhizoclosmatium globosum]|uniref:Nucleic acid-binding protein n=1 Tax=Rhizoclosmatium globosum TaxID=329046 RepID=A0A1Y2BEI6_9FUNG|nr:nucleic acid-binding protein [Rhizoclosmatium globosum]|eukprot:ORY33242.1 nucleic acid-binding protein [Rhizoclosmatium globosum]
MGFWKLAGLVRSFPNSCDTYWKKDVIVEQMMYRYQREYKDGKRSCLHLICEGDRTADPLIVLCIADVYVAGQSVLENGIDLRSIEESPVMVRVTDGWYSLKAHLDPTLSRAVLRGSLKIGQKIMIFGAQTVGEGQRPPLEIEDRLFMSLSSNGTRPAKWDAKLGYQARPYPFQVGIGSVVANGGPIPMMDIVVMRVYPICYVENKVMLSQAEEDEAERNYQIRYEKECQRLMFEYQKSSKGEGRSFEDYDIRGEVEERVPRRNVSRILKMLICDYPPDGHGVETTASSLLTIWNPDGGQTEVFKEGKRLKASDFDRKLPKLIVFAPQLFGLLPDGYKTDSGKSICPLKFGQKKIIIPMPVSAQQLEERTLYTPRTYMKIEQLNNLSQSDVFDVMGLVMSSTESDVCIVDETLKSVKVQSYSKQFGKVKVK